jgi:hypothetical protein
MRYKLIYQHNENQYEKIFESKKVVCDFLGITRSTFDNIHYERNKGKRMDILVYKNIKIESMPYTEEEKAERHKISYKKCIESLSEEQLKQYNERKIKFYRKSREEKIKKYEEKEKSILNLFLSNNIEKNE